MQPLLPEHPTTLIIGTGLLGGSLGLAMKAAGYQGRVLGLNRRDETSRAALAVGAIDDAVEGYKQAVEADLVVVGVPLSAFAGVFEQLARNLKPTAVITDLGSTKMSVQQAAEAKLSNPARFVGSHPMAGSEKQGPEAAYAELFDGKPCIVAPSEKSGVDAIAAVESLWQTLKMNVIRMTPNAHDQHVAATSHLPHAVAVMLVNVVAELTGYETASTGFRDTTRLAASNPSMRLDIMLANREALSETIDAAVGRLNTLKKLLDESDGDAIHAMLQDAQKKRANWLDA